MWGQGEKLENEVNFNFFLTSYFKIDFRLIKGLDVKNEAMNYKKP